MVDLLCTSFLLSDVVGVQLWSVSLSRREKKL